MDLFVGIKALAESVNLVAKGTAPRIPQTEEGATYDPALFKPETHQVRHSEFPFHDTIYIQIKLNKKKLRVLLAS